jgi:tryptophan halogenase
MRICIIGKGASGWMAATYLSRMMREISSITIIGSPEVKTIGVGESNTLALSDFHKELGISISEFVKNSDATIKYGVFYKNWGGNNFLHNFKQYYTWGENALYHFKSLSNKPKNVPIYDIIAPDLTEFTQKNQIAQSEKIYPKSWHFDAGMYISFLEKINLQDEKIVSIEDTVVECNFLEDEKIKNIILKSGKIIEADYYIFASGNSNFLENILNEKYESLSNVLLTDKALVYPLEYKNKRNQFHPYTVAKTMECGWRWITPTYSRVGTGYVYSSKYISDDEARNEFLKDIGDYSINPTVVKFNPRYNKKTFKKNYCTMGMSNGFLEPLDAPGLSITIQTIRILCNSLLKKEKYGIPLSEINFLIESNNHMIEQMYKRWACFILLQYKTSSTRKNKFWNDHRNVKWDYYEECIRSLEQFMGDEKDDFALMMFHTMAAKNFQWKSDVTTIPFQYQLTQKEKLMHHLDYINYMRNLPKFDVRIHSR